MNCLPILDDFRTFEVLNGSTGRQFDRFAHTT